MLVITRRQEESILIYCGDECIEIKVTDLNFSSVRLAFTANENVKIYRKELKINGNDDTRKEVVA